VSDVEKVRTRLNHIAAMVKAFLPRFPSAATTFSRAFNTSTLRAVLYGQFDSTPLSAKELKDVQTWIAEGFSFSGIEVPDELKPFAEKWWAELREELSPLAGKTIDPRFVKTILVQL
jgi:hypothetical protein